MVNRIGDINGIPLYESSTVEDGRLLKGHKGDSNNSEFIVVSPRTAKTILLEMERKNRLEKLIKINDTY